VSASAYGENAIFKESLDLASPEAASVDAFSADVSAEEAVVSLEEDAAVSVLEEHPAVSPRQRARERAGTTSFFIKIPPLPNGAELIFC